MPDISASESVEEFLARVDRKLDGWSSDNTDNRPNASPLDPDSFATTEQFRRAFEDQISAICNYLPLINEQNLPEYTFIKELILMARWLAPRYAQVLREGKEVNAFWRAFQEVMDTVWGDVPYVNSDGQPSSAAARSRLLRRLIANPPEVHPLEPERLQSSWLNELSLTFHHKQFVGSSPFLASALSGLTNNLRRPENP
ncbi:hypothetical protein H1R20_g2517, partial [Candolleomyces eurysporus]